MTIWRDYFPFKGIIVLLAAMLLGGCAVKETAVEKANRDQILLIGNGTEPPSLDPHLATTSSEQYILSALFEGLVTENPKTLAPEPGMAERWDISGGGTVYTFHLRSNARWSNGDPLTAQDFLYSYRRILTPELGAPYAYMLYVMQNAEAYNKGEIKDFAAVGVKALDDHTVRITLASPTPYFFELLYHYTWFPVHPPTIEKFGAFTARATRWTRPENFVCNGPFMLKSWAVNERIVAVKNQQYWDAAKVRLREIHFLPIDSIDTEERAFRAGYIHITNTVPLHRIDYYREKEPGKIRLDLFMGTYFYRLNVQKPPLNDRRVRLALALAIDREAICRHVLRAGQKPAFCFTPEGAGGYTARARLEHNPEKAQQLLAEAGFPDGKDFPSVELIFNTSEAHRTVAEAIQQMWKKTLNIEVKLLNQEWKVFLETEKNGDFFISRSGWIGDYNDPNSFLDLWKTGNGNNRTGWSNTEYDRLIEAAAVTADPAKRLEDFQQAEAILLGEMPVIPIYFYVRSALVSPAVHGWEPHLLDRHNYKYVWLEEIKN